MCEFKAELKFKNGQKFTITFESEQDVSLDDVKCYIKENFSSPEILWIKKV